MRDCKEARISLWLMRLLLIIIARGRRRARALISVSLSRRIVWVAQVGVGSVQLRLIKSLMRGLERRVIPGLVEVEIFVRGGVGTVVCGGPRKVFFEKSIRSAG